MGYIKTRILNSPPPVTTGIGVYITSYVDSVLSCIGGGYGKVTIIFGVCWGCPTNIGKTTTIRILLGQIGLFQGTEGGDELLGLGGLGLLQVGEDVGDGDSRQDTNDSPHNH